jgi:hypothetical protein
MNPDMTPFVESNALLAIIREDEDAAREVLADSSYHELVMLGRHAMELSRLACHLADLKAPER